MPDVTATSAGQAFRGYRRGGVSTDPVDQYVIPIRDRVLSYQGRAATFMTQGNAATTTQVILTLHNGGGSTLFVAINRITVDLLTTAAAGIAPSVQVPVVRVRRLTTASSGGTALSKVARGDSGLTTNGSVALLQGTASDGGALTAVTQGTSAGILAQKFSPRLLVVGTSASTLYEPVDTIPFFYGEPDITLKNGEGIAVTLEGQAAAGNPATNRWIAEVDWDEYTRP